MLEDWRDSSTIFSCIFSQTRGTPRNTVGRTSRRVWDKEPWKSNTNYLTATYIVSWEREPWNPKHLTLKWLHLLSKTCQSNSFTSQKWSILKLLHLLTYVYFIHSQVLKWPENLNSLRPRRNEQHFADDIFKRIFFNENVWISIKISLKFVPKGPINNIPALVQIMACRLNGAKPLSEPMMVGSPTHICVTRPQWVKQFSYCRYH